MDRQHRHQLKHDKFVDEVGALSARAQRSQRLLLTIAGVGIALALIIYGIYFYRSTRETGGQKLLATAIQTFEAPVGEEAQQQAAAGPTFKTEEERTAAAEKQFAEVRTQYAGTDAADVAGLYLARMQVSRGDSKAARQLLEQFITEQDDHILVSTARYSLYQLRIENGEAPQVIAEINSELARAEPILPGDALLMLLAQAHAAQGEEAKVTEAYRRITTEFPESPYVIEAQRRIGA